MRGARALIPLAAIGIGLGWILLRGISGNLVYFMTPTELLGRGQAAIGERMRLGGQVLPGSAQDTAGGVRFIITDGTTRLTVIDTGEVPPLFRSSIGVVVEGKYEPDGAFHADTLLVKHSADYRPPAPGETPTSAQLEDRG